MKKIGEILTGLEVACMTATDTVTAAAKEMSSRRIGAVLILDDAQEPIGIFTERDLMTRVIAKGLDPSREQLGTHMSKDLFTLSVDDTLTDSAGKMQDRHIRHVPVVQDGKVICLLSLRDLLRELLQIKVGEVRSLQAYIQGSGDMDAQ